MVTHFQFQEFQNKVSKISDKNSKKNRKIVLFGDDLKFLKNKFNTAIVSTDGPEDVSSENSSTN